MSIEHLVQMYRQGAMTDSEFFPNVLSLLCEDNLDHVMGSVPAESVHDLATFVARYDASAAYLSFGNPPRPTAAQAKMARQWLDQKKERPGA